LKINHLSCDAKGGEYACNAKYDVWFDNPVSGETKSGTVSTATEDLFPEKNSATFG
jgi:hypothetical protein